MKNSRQLARTAHDVRHLCVCGRCGELADDRDTVTYDTPASAGIHWHPQCFYERYGRQVVIERLPPDQQDKFRLRDVPAGVMKRLLQVRGD